MSESNKSSKEPLLSEKNKQILSEGQIAWDRFKEENNKWWKGFNLCVIGFCVLMCVLILLVFKNETTPEECIR